MKILSLLLGAWLIVALQGCTDMQLVQPGDDTATVQAGYGRAFGRIVFVEDGKEKQWDTGTFALQVLGLYVRAGKTGRIYHMEIKGDGHFVWSLPADDYTIIAWHQAAPVRSGRIWAGFSIARPGIAAYIGDLRIDEDRSRFSLVMNDRYDEALAGVTARLSPGGFAPARALMQLEDKLGRYTQILGICAESWGVKCESRMLGLEPLQPAGASQGYPVSASLKPLLEWKPSAKAGAHYDVAVYESLALAVDMPGMPRARGALVAYAEDIAEPRLQLDPALPPGRKYDWSVRLREGDTVSTWSTSGYFAFFVVGWASGSGLWFGLTTPDK